MQPSLHAPRCRAGTQAAWAGGTCAARVRWVALFGLGNVTSERCTPSKTALRQKARSPQWRQEEENPIQAKGSALHRCFSLGHLTGPSGEQEELQAKLGGIWWG